MAKTIGVQMIALADMVITSEDKKLTVVGIFDKMFIKSLPSVQARMVLVVTLLGEPRVKEKLQFRVLSPSKKEEIKADANFEFGENGKANLISSFEGFPINEVGSYEFRLEKEKKLIATFNLDVILINDANQASRRIVN